MDHPLTAPEAAALIAQRLPRWVVRSVELLGEGDFCTAHLVNGEWVFRFARHREAAESLAREACLLPRIARGLPLPVPVPQVVALDHRPPFVAYPLLPGPALTRERYLQLPPVDRDRCAVQVADFLARLHATDLAITAGCGLAPTSYPARHQEVLSRARVRLFGELAAPVRAFVERVIDEDRISRARPGANIREVLLHGDLSPEHILYDEAAAAVTGIIDFGDMAIGDPAWDLVYLYEDYGLDFLGRVLRHYPGDRAPPLLARVYRLYVIDAVEWASRPTSAAAPDLDQAIARIADLAWREAAQREELLAAGGPGG